MVGSTVLLSALKVEEIDGPRCNRSHESNAYGMSFDFAVTRKHRLRTFVC